MVKSVAVFQKPPAGDLVEAVYGVLGDVNLDYIPGVDECDWALDAGEYNIVVLPATVPTKVGSIIVPDEFREMTEAAIQMGRIVSLSPLAFTYANWPVGTRLPQVGDLVYYARYAGGEQVGFDGRVYRTIKDQDIMGRIPTIEERRATRRGFVGAGQTPQVRREPDALSDLRPSELSDLRGMTKGDLSGVHIFNAGEPAKEPVRIDEDQEHG